MLSKWSTPVRILSTFRYTSKVDFLKITVLSIRKPVSLPQKLASTLYTTAMPVHVLQGDIVRQHTDAIVTAANKQLMGGGGVDGAIHRAAGPQLLQAIDAIVGIPAGMAVMTRAFGLSKQGVKYVIHAVGPIWRGGYSGEAALLASAYTASLQLALEYGCQSVAFPAISTGVYGYPVAQAAQVSLAAIQGFLAQHPQLDVSVVLYDQATLEVFQRGLQQLGE